MTEHQSTHGTHDTGNQEVAQPSTKRVRTHDDGPDFDSYTEEDIARAIEDSILASQDIENEMARYTEGYRVGPTEEVLSQKKGEKAVITDPSEILTSLTLDYGPFRDVVPLFRAAALAKGSESLWGFNHLQPTQPTAWANGFSARKRYWTNSPLDGVASTRPLTFDTVSEDLVCDIANSSEASKVILHYSQEYFQHQIDIGAGFGPNDPRMAVPLWDRYRYDQDAGILYTVNQTFTWSKYGKAADILRPVISSLVMFVLGKIKKGGPHKPEILNKDKRSLKSDEKETIAMDSACISYEMWEKFVGEFESYSGGQRLTEITNDVLRNPTMWTSTVVHNTVRHIQTFRGATVALKDGAERFSIGEKVLPNPESMLSPSLSCAWAPDIDSTLDEKAVQRLMQAYRSGNTPDPADEAAILPRLREMSPVTQNYFSQAFPDPEEQETIKRIFASWIFNEPVKLFYYLCGTTGAGKTAMVGMLNGILERGAIGRLSLDSIQDRRGASDSEDSLYAPLLGATVATIASELSQNTIVNTTRAKSVTNGGGDMLRGRAPYGMPVDIKFSGPVVCTGNAPHRDNDDGTGAWAARYVFVPFTTKLQTDHSLNYEDLYKKEAPWFVLDIMMSYQRWMAEGGGREGLNIPAKWDRLGETAIREANLWYPVEQSIKPADYELQEGEEGIMVEGIGSKVSEACAEISDKLGLYRRTHRAWSVALTKLTGDAPEKMSIAGQQVRGRRFMFVTSDEVTAEEFRERLYYVALR
jgi:energy-coupling factor transporter ATP-binding protein EcfA2